MQSKKKQWQQFWTFYAICCFRVRNPDVGSLQIDRHTDGRDS